METKEVLIPVQIQVQPSVAGEGFHSGAWERVIKKPDGEFQRFFEGSEVVPNIERFCDELKDTLTKILSIVKVPIDEPITLNISTENIATLTVPILILTKGE